MTSGSHRPDNPSDAAWSSLLPGFEARAFTSAIWRRKYLAGFAALGVVLAAGIYTALATPIYRAQSSVLIENKFQTIVPDVETGIDYIKEVTRAQRSLALSLPVLKRAAEIAGTDQWSEAGQEVDPLAPLGGRNINATTEGQLLELAVLNPDPHRASALANAWATAFVEEMGRRDRSGSVYTRSFLDGQLPELRKKWQDKRKALHAFRSETNFDPRGIENHPVTQRLGKCSRDVAEKRANRAELLSEAKTWEAAGEKLESLLRLPRARRNEKIRRYEVLIQNQEKKLVDVRARFMPDSLEVLKAEQTLRDIEKLCRDELSAVAEEVRLELQVAEEEVKQFTVLYEAARAEHDQLLRNAFKDGLLASDVRMAQQQYEELAKRHREADVAGRVTYSYAQPWELAEVPLAPYRPSWPRNMALGLLLGLLLAGASVYAAELFDDSVHSAQQMQELLGVKVLGSVPLVEKHIAKHSGYLLARDHPHLPTVECLRIVRSGLAACAPAVNGDGAAEQDEDGTAAAHRGMVLLVTSACPLDGKSFLSSNLSLLFALENKKVLLIDADLYKAKLSALHGQQNARGLTELAQGPCRLEDLVQPTSKPGLWVLAAGKPADSPASVIESPHLPALLDQAREEYDYVLIDSAPLLSVADAGVLATLCDLVLVSARSRQTSLSQARRTAEILQRVKARDLVFVLNGMDAFDARYDGYHYGSGYGRAYGEARGKDKDEHGSDWREPPSKSVRFGA